MLIKNKPDLSKLAQLIKNKPDLSKLAQLIKNNRCKFENPANVPLGRPYPVSLVAL